MPFTLHHHPQLKPWRPKHHRRHLPCPNQPLLHWNNMASSGRRPMRSRLSPLLPQSQSRGTADHHPCRMFIRFVQLAYASLQCDHNMCFECFGAAQADSPNVLIVPPMTIAPVKQIRWIFKHQPSPGREETHLMVVTSGILLIMEW